MLPINSIIAIDMGHCLQNADTGARGIKAEEILTREVGIKVINKLKELGYKVVNCTIDSASSVNESLAYRVNIANNSKANLFASIHFNCGGGKGTEVFTYGGNSFDEAQDILNNIVALGYVNRGIKDGSTLYVLRNTSMKAMLIECAFVDSEEDMTLYNSENLANAIVKGISGMNSTTQTTSNQSQQLGYDPTIPSGNNIFRIGNYSYIEETSDGRTIVHRDRGNYISIGQGFIDIYWNDGKGKAGSKRISE